MNSSDLQRLVASAGSQHFGDPRFAAYVSTCGGDVERALLFYQWNVEASGAMWETIGHLEVVLRNRVADRLAHRHHRLGRADSWLDTSFGDLDYKARQDIDKACDRLRRKGKPVSDGPVIAELSFGFTSSAIDWLTMSESGTSR